jgi:hypothetical protein
MTGINSSTVIYSLSTVSYSLVKHLMVDVIMITDVAHADRTLAQPIFNNFYRQNDLFYLSHLNMRNCP